MLSLSEQEIQILLRLLDATPVSGRNSRRLVSVLEDKLETELTELQAQTEPQKGTQQ